MQSILVLCLLSTALGDIRLSSKEEKEAILALQNPDLYDGDMYGVNDDSERNAKVGNHFRWPDARAPYVIDSSLSSQTKLIQQGFDDYHKNTCVRFVPRTTEEAYIKIFSGHGCYSAVGRMGTQQLLSLGNGCMYVGTIVHELGHALGFYHEQSRSDRDHYLIIYLENASPRTHGNFRKLSPEENILYNAFNYDSIMIYGNDAFSQNGKSTMVARNGQALKNPYSKKGMTASDIERVRKMYNC